MKITIPNLFEIEVTTIRIVLPVMYDEDDIPNDFPFRKNDQWTADIDIEIGKIDGWPAGRSGIVEMKVCDQGCYYLIDKSGIEIASIENDYVPNRIIPGKYGDYVDLQINEDGEVTNWKKPSEEALLEAFYTLIK